MIKPYLNAIKNFDNIPDINKFNIHYHDDYELYCFLRGSAKYYVEGNVYNLNHGDILILQKAESHVLLIDKLIPYERMNINFNKEAILGDLSDRITDFIDNRPLGKYVKFPAVTYSDNVIISYIEKICSISDFEEKRLYLTFVLNELCKTYPDDTATTDTSNIASIIRYINAHLFESINLDVLSQTFYISKGQLIRKFKIYTGTTVWDYITTKRLIYARELLQNGDKPTSVYLKCGFNDYVTFYKAYKKKYGASPSSYCAANRTESKQ